MLHERAQSEPQAVEDAEVVGQGAAPAPAGDSARSARTHSGTWVVARVQQAPLVRREPRHYEQHDAHTHVREYDAHPDLLAQRIQEAEHAWFLLHRLLDHDTDSQGHERLAEVDDSLAFGSDCHRSYRDVSFLRKERRKKLYFYKRSMYTQCVNRMRTI